MSGLARTVLAGVGGFARAQWQNVHYVAGVLGTLLFEGAKPHRWRRTVRNVFARQVLFCGLESVRFVVVVAILVGISVVVQAEVWVERIGQTRMLGPLLVSVVAREIGPLIANLVLIVRSGSAIVSELGSMQVGGEVRVLEAQGIEPLFYLVMPRVLALAVSALCLTVIFVLVAFASGYAFGGFLGLAGADPGVFLNSVFKALSPDDTLSIILKCLLPALLTGVICCTEGLSAGRAITEVPQAVNRALARSLAALFITSAAISFLTYI
jgi:phospholipid/cholesterol/gamma-HCH transport system permease protein